jgi:hypothetical protein
MDYYGSDGELAGNDGRANDDFLMLLRDLLLRRHDLRDRPLSGEDLDQPILPGNSVKLLRRHTGRQSRLARVN